MPDTIRIAHLKLTTFIGVPEEERAAAQELTVSLVLEPGRGFAELADDIAKTVDYFAVCQAVKVLAAERPRRLIETLAEEIAALVLARFPVRAVEVELFKYILDDTDSVSVRCRREATE